MASLDTLIFCYKLYGTIYLRQHAHQVYHDATEHLLRKLELLKQRKDTEKNKASETADTEKTAQLELSDSVARETKAMKRKGSLAPLDVNSEIAKIVLQAIEKAKEGFILSTPKYAFDIENIHNQWKEGTYDSIEQNEKALALKIANLEAEVLTLKTAKDEQKEESQEDPRAELIKTQTALIETQKRTLEEKEAAIKKLQAELNSARQTVSISALPQISRTRALSDTSSQHSAQSAESTTANPKSYREHVEKVLGKKRFAIVDHLAAVPPVPTVESKSTLVNPYRELIAILCRDALSAQPKPTHELVAAWDKQQQIDLAKFEKMEDKPNPRYFVQEKRQVKRIEAGYLLGYTLQKGFLGSTVEKNWQNGFIAIELGKELAKTKLPAPSVGVSSTPLVLTM